MEKNIFDSGIPFDTRIICMESSEEEGGNGALCGCYVQQ